MLEISSSTFLTAPALTTEPVVVRVRPNGRAVVPDMVRLCHDCSRVTGGRCWRHGTIIWISEPEVISSTTIPTTRSDHDF